MKKWKKKKCNLCKFVMVNRFRGGKLEYPCEGFEYGTSEHTTPALTSGANCNSIWLELFPK